MFRRLFAVFSALILLGAPAFVSADDRTQSVSDKIVVVIDAGHGGKDEGASGTHSEAWYNLQVSLFCAKKLKKNDAFEVYLTRDGDYFLSVTERGIFADKVDADILISMHFNSIRGSKNTGIEVYSSVLDRFDPQPLCEMIADNLAEVSGLPIHDLYRRRDSGDTLYFWSEKYQWDVPDDPTAGPISDFYGIPTWAAKFGFPGIIVEHAYLSNAADLAVVDQPGMLKLMGEADADAIIEYFTGHVHEYESDFTVDQPVSCISAGKKSVHCKHCCHRINVQPVAGSPSADGHFWMVKNKKSASCEEDGFVEYECRYTQNLIDKEISGYEPHLKKIVLPKTGHDYEVVFTQELTHTQDGITKYRCKNCGKTFSDVTKAQGHSFELKSHTDPGCETPGEDVWECAECGEIKSEEIAPLGHKFRVLSKTPALCEEGGEKVSVCDRCGLEITEIIESPGHDFELTDTVDPTCENDGYREFTCRVCDEKKTEVLEALGHEFSVDGAKEPDCVNDGYTYLKCSRCDEIQIVETIPALGHKYTSRVTREAGEGVDGERLFVCEICGDEYAVVIPSLKARTSAADPVVEAAASLTETTDKHDPVFETVGCGLSVGFAACLSVGALLRSKKNSPDPDGPAAEADGGEDSEE